MKRKRWGILAALGLAGMLLGGAVGRPRPLSRLLVLGGVLVFCGGMTALTVYNSQHPPLRCPHCGRGLYGRRLQGPGGHPPCDRGRAGPLSPLRRAVPAWAIRPDTRSDALFPRPENRARFFVTKRDIPRLMCERW